MTKKYSLAFAAITAITLTAGSSSAATLSCMSGGTTFSLGASDATACFAGNDSNTIDSNFVMFGMSGWTLADKNDDATSGDQSITFGQGPANNVKSGSWDITDITGFSKVVLNLKSGNDWGSFLVSTTSGTWSTSKDLSHASIYYIDAPTPVPLPAGGLLLISALGAGALASRRKRS